MSLEREPQKHFVRMRVLDVSRRLRSARQLLESISGAQPPILAASRDTADLLNLVVLFPEVVSSNEHSDVGNINEDENDIVDAGDADDADPGEGGEPNPEDELLLTFRDI